MKLTNSLVIKALLLTACLLNMHTVINAAEMKQAEAKDLACASELPTNIQALPDVLDLLLPNGTTEHINKCDEAPILMATFEDLINEQRAAGDTLIIARVTTKDNTGKQHISYYDAHAFNQHLLTEFSKRLARHQHRGELLDNAPMLPEYPIDPRPKAIILYTLPMSDQEIDLIMDPFRRSITSNLAIQYFALNQNNQFEFLFSGADLFTNPNKNIKTIHHMTLYANQNKNLQIKAHGLYELAFFYEDGVNIARDTKKALYYFSRAADQSADLEVKAHSQYSVATLYRDGEIDSTKDYCKAVHYFTLAAEQNNEPSVKARAHYQLGNIYSHGFPGVKQDIQKALAHYAKTTPQVSFPTEDAQAVYAKALFRLGQINYYGLYGMPQNYAGALLAYKNAANQTAHPQTSARAQFMLGTMYRTGNGVEQNYEIAFAHYHKAAQQTDDLQVQADALLEVGKLLAQGGHSLKQDLPKALYYLRLILTLSEAGAPLKKQAHELIKKITHKVAANPEEQKE